MTMPASLDTSAAQRESEAPPAVAAEKKTETEHKKHKRTRYTHRTLGLRRWRPKSRRGPELHPVDAGECFGVDFGGTLTKVVFFEPDEIPEDAKALAHFVKSGETYGKTGVRDAHLGFYSAKLGGTFHFMRFESSRTRGAMALLSKMQAHNMRTLHSTGGGAHKYADLFQKELGVTLIKNDELETVVRGIVFVLLEDTTHGECYSYEPREPDKEYRFQNEMQVNLNKVPRSLPITDDALFPLIVVNIGSGVSLIKVDSPNSFRRISGTAIGGGTYYGLAKLLTRCTSYDSAMDLAEEGDSRLVNLLVQDIYGGSYDRVGLPGEMTASFFGKAAATHGASRPSSSSTVYPRWSRARLLVPLIRWLRDSDGVFKTGVVLAGFLAMSFNLAITYGTFGTLGYDVNEIYKVSVVLPFLLLLAYMYRHPDSAHQISASDIALSASFASSPATTSAGLLSGGCDVGANGSVDGGLSRTRSASVLRARNRSGSVGKKVDTRRHSGVPPAGPYKSNKPVPVTPPPVKPNSDKASSSPFSPPSAFERLAAKLEEDHPHIPEEVFMDEDICRALVVMVAQNVTQIAYLNAIIHGCTRIVFTGNFLRHNEIAMRILSNSLRIWSKGQIHALFMEHEGYFGAVGAFLYSLGVDAKGKDDAGGKGRSDSVPSQGTNGD